MPIVRASAAFKKRDGALILGQSQQAVSWTPTAPPGSNPEVTVPISGITNLQQTPPDKPRVMLKVFAQTSGAIEPVIYTFTFTSPTNARGEADALRDALSKAVQAAKAASSAPAPAPAGDGVSSAMAVASALASDPSLDADSWYSDDKLKSNIELQQALLKANPVLSKTFMESLRTKPDSITSSQFTSQFWASRLSLLRAFAIERSQRKGGYNVLATLKSRTEDNVTKLNVTREQINILFDQYPLVKRVYDETVPKLSEQQFWARFFQSRLLKKLRGERVTEADSKDVILDKYLTVEEDTALRDRLSDAHVPHIIDVQGNEENHSQRKGNAPDLLMRPSSTDRVPIIRTLNSLSEKIMSQVAPNDVDPSAPIGVDEATFNALALRDLQGDAVENRRILNVKDLNSFFASGKEDESDPATALYEKQNPAKVLLVLRADLAHAAGSNLDQVIGVNADSDSDDDDAQDSHVGSRASFRAASVQIFDAIRDQVATSDDVSPSQFSGVASAATSHLKPDTFKSVELIHATTSEFLHHFWSAFLSGEPSRADEIRKLVETLDRAMDRISAVTQEAEADRQKDIDGLKRQVREHYERTHRKLEIRPDSVKGGAKAVTELLTPTVEAVRVATKKYADALLEQEAAVSAVAA